MITEFKYLKSVDGIRFASIWEKHTFYIDSRSVVFLPIGSHLNWKYLDTGEGVPGMDCSDQYEAWKAREKYKEEDNSVKYKSALKNEYIQKDHPTEDPFYPKREI